MFALPPGWLITGFGPFGSVLENPSAELARRLSPDAVILPVTYQAVDEFLRNLPVTQCLLMCGVHPSAATMRLELMGHNEVTGLADIAGVAPTGSILEGVPDRLGSTLVPPALADILASGQKRGLRLSIDGGRYLCNYSLFRALAVQPQVRSAFLHIPPFEVMSLRRQVRLARWLIEECHRAWYL